VRPSLSILLNLAVLTAFAQAPFLHTHQHEATAQHPGPFFHFHLKYAHAAGRVPGLQGLDPNEDAQYQRWFSAASIESVSITPAIAAEPFVLVVFDQDSWTSDAPLPIAHGPPRFSPRSPRAPPA
jgi:hypothetical protein